MAKNFQSRAFDHVLENQVEYFNEVGYAFRGKHDKCWHAKYQVAAHQIHLYEEVEYNEWDLRGLTNIEKDFIRENGMKNYIDIRDFSCTGKTERIYLIIRKNSVGRKVLCGFMKKQWIDLNADYFTPFGKNVGFNYDKVLTFRPDRGNSPFSVFDYERIFHHMVNPFGLF